ncbi:MAG: hypothetical protein WDN28_14220 [Chthoniobacter sp.]
MRFPRFLALLLVLRWPLAMLLAADPPAVVIATYNVENYLGEEAVAAETGAHHGRPKAEKSIDAVVQVIKDINPDILAVCENGRAGAVRGFQEAARERRPGL